MTDAEQIFREDKEADKRRYAPGGDAGQPLGLLRNIDEALRGNADPLQTLREVQDYLT